MEEIIRQNYNQIKADIDLLCVRELERIRSSDKTRHLLKHYGK
jgi:hypothetical protein